eukprot:TRINITY_DN38688_c0_g1_i2.p1 TRINITY_DN38688_c0_g1~~TRINITY_DN38688_c0_g1_i2.p1  ORF type:complete len:458 (+),score=80.29 TRINITY_DN38688_c0_g1_i2:27-1400(+)
MRPALLLLLSPAALVPQVGSSLTYPLANCWCGGFGAHAAVFDRRLWIVGGYGGGVEMPDEHGSPTALCGAGTSSEFSSRVWHHAGRNWVEISDADHPRWSPRRGLALVAGLSSSLWVIAGRDVSGGLLADVWSSQDGLVWSQVTASAAFTAREGHGALLLSGSLLLFGGHDGASELADVWSSSDGASWMQRAVTAAWSARRDFGAAVHGGKAFLVGGYGPAGALDDVWSSSDGSSWSREASGPWGTKVGPGLTSFDGYLWLMGGYKLLSTATMRHRPYQQRWSPTNAAVEVRYASKRLAFSDLELSGGNGYDVLVNSMQLGGLAQGSGVKVGDRLVSVHLYGQDRDWSAFVALDKGGIASAPVGPLTLTFEDATDHFAAYSSNWFLDDRMAYHADMWKSQDGVDWMLVSEHRWPGLPECQDSFAMLTAEAGPYGLRTRLEVLSGASGEQFYVTAAVS